MQKIILFTVLSILMLSVSSCSENDIEKKLKQASMSIEKEDYEMAQVYCDALYAGLWDNLTVKNKCDLAICYLALVGTREINEDSNMAAMRRCYESAMKENPQETKDYLSSIIDDETDVNMYDTIELIIGLDNIGKELNSNNY